jgi:glyoxylase-like metal-dependent hydrolase (beta-lactamase superfamily II)
VITYGDSVTMHLNGENIELIKAPPAHTDGDTYVFFRSSNVLHLGDVFRTGAFPVIDTANGGTAAGTIAALELAVELAGPDTVVLPGHGQVSTETDVQSFLDMVIDVEARVSRLIEQGMSLEQIVAADPTAAYAERELGSPDRFLTGLFESLTSN